MKKIWRNNHAGKDKSKLVSNYHTNNILLRFKNNIRRELTKSKV